MISNNFIKSVKVLSEDRAPEIHTKVRVQFHQSGTYTALTVDMRRPTYFEKLVVARVHEILPSLRSASLPLNSIHNVAHQGYNIARGFYRSILPPVGVEAPVFDTRSAEPNNVAHLLLDLIPYCLHARNIAGPEVVCLFQKLGSQFARLLEVFKISPLCERRRVKAETIRIRGTRGLAVYDLLGTFDCWGINFFPNIYSAMTLSSSIGFERVFLARRGPRGLINQAEIEALVSRYGYKTVFMEDYSIHDQLSIGARAKHVVAVHGAAMSFLVMNQNIDSVIELLPPNVYHELFPVCLSPRVGRYEQIIPEFDQAVAHSGWQTIVRFKNARFSTDAKLLENCLSEMH